MSFLKNIFGGSDTEKSNTQSIWLPLTDSNQLSEIKENSFNSTQVVFKHSTRCIISRTALKQFENEFNSEIKPFYLDLLNYRNISNEIADLFDITHQSPQMLIIKNGVCVFSSTHENIDANDINKF